MPRSRSASFPLVFAVAILVTASSVVAKDKIKDPKHAKQSGIEHVVVVTMENRSFDHLLGWHPTANAMQAGLAYPDPAGTLTPTAPLAPDFQGCGHPDPDHSWQGSRTSYDGGAMDGFLVAGQNDAFAIGYYQQEDRPFFDALAL
jgi:phospholipase C